MYKALRENVKELYEAEGQSDPIFWRGFLSLQDNELSAKKRREISSQAATKTKSEFTEKGIQQWSSCVREMMILAPGGKDNRLLKDTTVHIPTPSSV